MARFATTPELAQKAVTEMSSTEETAKLGREIAQCVTDYLIELHVRHGDAEDQSWQRFREIMLPAVIRGLVLSGGTSERAVREAVLKMLS